VIANSPHLPNPLVELFVVVARWTGDRNAIAGRQQCLRLRADAYVARERQPLADDQDMVHAANSR
jgi:hypothetical protein